MSDQKVRMKGTMKSGIGPVEFEGDATIDGKLKYRLAVWKIVAQVIIAALGVVGTYLGIIANQKGAANTAALQETVDRMNKEVIPAIQRALDGNQGEHKAMIEAMGSIRERTASLEGGMKLVIAALASRSGKPKEPEISPATTSEKKLKEEVDWSAVKRLTKKSDPEVPTLQVEQMVKGD